MTPSRFFDIGDEPTRMLAPVDGYQAYPLMPLEVAIEPLVNLIDGIQARVWISKENCNVDEANMVASPLTQDEAASIYLYTMEWTPSQRSLYYILNQTLRSENRQQLIPWFGYLKLFFSALHKLPSCTQTVWRGVKENLVSQYPIGKQKVWWGVSSCTESLQVLESSKFLGKTGDRTLFSIECKHGKNIRPYSYFKTEAEIVLMPGTFFEVFSRMEPAHGLHLIHLKEITPPYNFVQTPFTATESVATTPLPPTVSTPNQEWHQQKTSLRRQITTPLPPTVSTPNQEWHQQKMSLRRQIEEKKKELIELQAQKIQREQKAFQDMSQYSQMLSSSTPMYSGGHDAAVFSMIAMGNLRTSLNRNVVNQARIDINNIKGRISSLQDEIKRLERQERQMRF